MDVEKKEEKVEACWGGEGEKKESGRKREKVNK